MKIHEDNPGLTKSTFYFTITTDSIIKLRVSIMTISEQIKILCVRSNISVAGLAQRLGRSPQALNAKFLRTFELPS